MQTTAAGGSTILKKIEEYVDHSQMLVTAPSPVIGYDKASRIAHYAMDNNLTLKEAVLKLGFVTKELFDRDQSQSSTSMTESCHDSRRID